MNLPIPNKEAYLKAKPFPHLVIDGVFTALSIEFITRNWPKEHEFNPNSSNNQKLKSYTTSESKMDWRISSFIKTEFQSQEFILFLEELIGIKGLVMDIRGGYALHETFPGGSLQPHLDYLIHDVTGLQHRVNAILYLNDCEGGELELYEMNRAYGGYLTSKVSIPAKFNRLVIFNINEKAWHGHSVPLRSEFRRSIALNYFSLPDKDARDIKTTFGSTKKNIWKQVIPPIFYKLIK